MYKLETKQPLCIAAVTLSSVATGFYLFCMCVTSTLTCSRKHINYQRVICISDIKPDGQDYTAILITVTHCVTRWAILKEGGQ